MAQKEEPTKPFQYSDSPDGEDIFPKLWYALKPAAMVAFAASTVDVVLYSHPKGYLQTLGRYVHCSWPILTATSLFVLTHNMAAAIRRKDDKINWALAGVAAGSIYGLWKKNGVTMITIGEILCGLGLVWTYFTLVPFYAGMAGGFAAVAKKHCLQNGYVILPEPKTQIGGLRSCNQDWTLFKHRPGNWTTGVKE